jgi:putative DNA primase/helicase
MTAAHTAPGVQPEAIPAELRALSQWVAWRYETRGDKRTKTPINAKSNGRLVYAKSNDPETWASLADALEACGRHADLDGIGFCFAPDDGLTGIDLDHVIDTDTGELKPEAAEILERFSGTYAEVSPSGTGLRLFTFGKPGRSGKNTGAVKWCEVYSHPSSRYLTVTGQHWSGSATAVTQQQDALDWLHERFMTASTGSEKQASAQPVDAKARPLNLDDAALLDKARAARNGTDFERLWSGDTSGQGGDDSAADLALCNLLAFWTGGDAARIDRLFRQSGLFRSKWDSKRGDAGTYGAWTVNKAVAGCREFYGDRQGVRSEARPEYQAERDARRNAGDGLNPYRGTDDANADLLLGLHGADIRYCPPWDKWLIWSGSHWRIDDRLDIDRLAVDISRSLRERAITLTRQRQSILEKIAELLAAMNATAGAFESLGPQHARLVKQQTEIGSEIDWLMKLSGKLEGTAKRAAMLLAARHKVVVHHSDLDQGRFLLNTLSGTIDLKTGKVYDHRRSDLLTHDAAIQYDPAATCPTWTRFLSEVFAGDADLIEFVRRAVGYSLTGDVREQVLLICHGSGSNGKSVFLNILKKLLGRLALQAAPDLLMADRNRRHPTEQADLYGRRAVVCQETEENRRFNEVLVKQLTGGDTVRARRMREDFWEFEPTWKIWLSTNHRPEIRGTDHAIWRRVRLIPFTVTFLDPGKGEPTKDPAMEEKLTAELPGILAWAVQGCLAWQRDGLPTPKAVHDATEEYRDQQDIMAAWLKDCCVIKKLADAKAADLYASYSAWCEANGERPEPQRRFGMRLTERGFQRQRRMVGIWWLGVGLLETDPHARYERNEPDSAEKQLEEKEAFPEAFIGEIDSFRSYGSCATSKSPESPLVDTDLDVGEI